MVKHIVLFQIKQEIEAEQKKNIMETFQKDILALTDVIDIIRDIKVGFNINTDEKWDICLESSFDTLEDVRFYSQHPAHVAAASKLKPHLSGRSCVDFEL